jgi:predicted transcriptional regulator
MVHELIAGVNNIFNGENAKNVVFAGLGGFLIGNTLSPNEILFFIIGSTTRVTEIAIQMIQTHITMESDMSRLMMAGITQQLIQVGDGIRKERNRWEIIRDVLIVTEEEVKAKKTRIMQKACLDWRNFQRYFDFLLEEGFMAEINNPHKGNYEITEKGKILLKRLKEVADMLN